MLKAAYMHLLLVLCVTLPVMHLAKALAHWLDVRMTNIEADLLMAKASRGSKHTKRPLP